MYKLVFTKIAERNLKSLNKDSYFLIKNKLLLLSQDPNLLENNIKRLKNTDAFRLRVGNYRVIFEKDEGVLKIIIIKIKHRSEVYK